MAAENHPSGPRANIRDFYEELAVAKEESEGIDKGTSEFIRCLVASADYDSFYTVRVTHVYGGHEPLLITETKTC